MKSNELFFKENKRIVKIATQDILFVESYKDYMCIHTQTNAIKIRVPLWIIEEKLSDSAFIRVHKSFIINLKHIDSFSASSIEVKGQKIPIGRTYKKVIATYLYEQLIMG